MLVYNNHAFNFYHPSQTSLLDISHLTEKMMRNIVSNISWTISWPFVGSENCLDHPPTSPHTIPLHHLNHKTRVCANIFESATKFEPIVILLMGNRPNFKSFIMSRLLRLAPLPIEEWLRKIWVESAKGENFGLFVQILSYEWF